jgi:hypothetical protein
MLPIAVYRVDFGNNPGLFPELDVNGWGAMQQHRRSRESSEAGLNRAACS